MPYSEDDLLPVSALQHLLFCPRQCALIHVERLWQENRLTVEGRLLHRRAHDGPAETRDGMRITRGLPLRSLELGLAGTADVVTFRPPATAEHAKQTLAELFRQAQASGLRDWQVTPIEYKRGRPKTNDCDRVQLCAQAICLEEMLGLGIESGELFYGRKRRRTRVDFGPDLEADHANRRGTAARIDGIGSHTTRSAPAEVRHLFAAAVVLAECHAADRFRAPVLG